MEMVWLSMTKYYTKKLLLSQWYITYRNKLLSHSGFVCSFAHQNATDWRRERKSDNELRSSLHLVRYY